VGVGVGVAGRRDPTVSSIDMFTEVLVAPIGCCLLVQIFIIAPYVV
jgi:hypothetical protein